MLNFMKTSYLYGFILFVSGAICCHAQTPSNANYPSYRYALVRDLSSSFENSLKLNPPPIPIDLSLAKQQHEAYIQLLETLVQDVIRVEADANHPDCNFIEDTAIIVGDTAVISRMGAIERQGEEIPVAQALEQLGVNPILHIQAPGTMDGGDILYTGKHLFVGLSRRTNALALQQLQEIFQGSIDVIGIPVTEGLHLKSVISFFDSETLVIAATDAGLHIQNEIENVTNQDYTFISVPDSTASNVLRIGSTLIVQDGFPVSKEILQAFCDQKQVNLVTINMSELIKADGALTCGCLLFN